MLNTVDLLVLTSRVLLPFSLVAMEDNCPKPFPPGSTLVLLYMADPTILVMPVLLKFADEMKTSTDC